MHSYTYLLLFLISCSFYLYLSLIIDDIQPSSSVSVSSAVKVFINKTTECHSVVSNSEITSVFPSSEKTSVNKADCLSTTTKVIYYEANETALQDVSSTAMEDIGKFESNRIILDLLLIRIRLRKY